jgi:DNA-binding NarL/FixJ family response regulator
MSEVAFLRALVVHPEPLVGRAMAQFLRLQAGVEMADFVRTLAEAAQHLGQARAPVVVLVHEQLLTPDADALARDVRPLALGSRFLLLTDSMLGQASGNCQAQRLARQARLDGVVFSDQPLTALAQTVGAAIKRPARDARANASVPPEDGRPERFTPRQHQVLELLLQGHSNKLIARQLGITENTVKEYVSALLKRFDVKRRAELMAHLQQL